MVLGPPFSIFPSFLEVLVANLGGITYIVSDLHLEETQDCASPPGTSTLSIYAHPINKTTGRAQNSYCYNHGKDHLYGNSSVY